MHFKVVKIEKRKILQFFALNNTITIGVVSLKLLESITKPSTHVAEEVFAGNYTILFNLFLVINQDAFRWREPLI